MNMYPQNDFLKGQIVGRLFGSNTTSTSDSLTAFYAEQRAIPFLYILQESLMEKLPLGHLSKSTGHGAMWLTVQEEIKVPLFLPIRLIFRRRI
jgi:hypothetical protein